MKIHVFSGFTEFDRTVNKFRFKSKYFNVAVVYVDMKEVGSIFGNFENQDVLKERLTEYEHEVHEQKKKKKYWAH